MKRISIAALFIVLAGFLSPAAVADHNANDPFKLVREVADGLFSRIANEQAQIKQNPEVLRTIVAEELAPSINHKYAAAMVLGRYRNDTTEEQREKYYDAFQKYLIATYAGILTLYDDQQVVFEPAYAIDGQKIVVVKTRVLDEGKPDIRIDFKLRKNSKTDEWSAYDMVAEGISVLDSKRAELQGLIRQQGLDSVTALLLEKAEKPIEKKELGV
ncbi:phospholipid-binding protein MlaC [Psychrosphaera ytuae]|uniref:Phospholipid-binding protein MlaC n=1 Tax=Psychrosphaera ytuae TaxID=2820710 RepID=A0A975HHQ7_9GAMM|nr:phospholipid-binding protein MlaC [Psychrosphaera ytuae]QTH63436.1 phospholipid-binding protein MlaC [Psychrosphaera ytuae]